MKQYFFDNMIIIDKGNNLYLVKVLDEKKLSTRSLADRIYGIQNQKILPSLREQRIANSLENNPSLFRCC